MYTVHTVLLIDSVFLEMTKATNRQLGKPCIHHERFLAYS